MKSSTFAEKNYAMNGFAAILISFIAGVITFVLMFWLSFFVACEVSPPYVTDPHTGELHPVMAIGQSLIALLVAFFTGLVVWVLAFRKIRKRQHAG